MKTQREKRLPPAAKVIIAAAIVIGIPLVEFFWWMRFVHLGVPYYEADSYEELDTVYNLFMERFFDEDEETED